MAGIISPFDIAGICAPGGLILSAIFHGWALFRIFGGFKGVD